MNDISACVAPGNDVNNCRARDPLRQTKAKNINKTYAASEEWKREQLRVPDRLEDLDTSMGRKSM